MENHVQSKMMQSTYLIKKRKKIIGLRLHFKKSKTCLCKLLLFFSINVPKNNGLFSCLRNIHLFKEGHGKQIPSSPLRIKNPFKSCFTCLLGPVSTLRPPFFYRFLSDNTYCINGPGCYDIYLQYYGLS